MLAGYEPHTWCHAETMLAFRCVTSLKLTHADLPAAGSGVSGRATVPRSASSRSASPAQNGISRWGGMSSLSHAASVVLKPKS